MATEPGAAPEALPEFVVKGKVVIPVEHRITEVIVARRDETGQSGMLTGIDSTAPLPPPTIPKKSEGDLKMSGGHGEHGGGSEKVAMAWQIVALVAAGIFLAWLILGKPNIFGIRDWPQEPVHTDGFQGVSPSPRYRGGGHAVPSRGREEDGQRYCYVPGTVFLYWKGSGVNRVAHCGYPQ